MLLYGLVIPPSALVVLWASRAEYRLQATAAILLICGLGALQVALTRHPSALAWIDSRCSPNR